MTFFFLELPVLTQVHFSRRVTKDWAESPYPPWNAVKTRKFTVSELIPMHRARGCASRTVAKLSGPSTLMWVVSSWRSRAATRAIMHCLATQRECHTNSGRDQLPDSFPLWTPDAQIVGRKCKVTQYGKGVNTKSKKSGMIGCWT